ncbi:MAG: V-type ATP synthase subunit D [Spirochaetes bacterium]|nr:V-type ATP synthase subunit D [Spirochaetota bacterium]
MSLKYQFNKISLQLLRKQLKIRETALPTLKSKEAALRLTVKKYKNILKDLKKEYEQKLASLESFKRLWAEFPEDIFSLKEVILDIKKIAGIKIPILKQIDYEIKDFSRFIRPAWLTTGLVILKEITELITNIKITEKSIEILEYARKKTTQKVNLYEKVQIPLYNEAILKIKRFLEDIENLEKAAQKITKQRHAIQEKLA